MSLSTMFWAMNSNLVYQSNLLQVLIDKNTYILHYMLYIHKVCYVDILWGCRAISPTVQSTNAVTKQWYKFPLGSVLEECLCRIRFMASMDKLSSDTVSDRLLSYIPFLYGSLHNRNSRRLSDNMLSVFTCNGLWFISCWFRDNRMIAVRSHS